MPSLSNAKRALKYGPWVVEAVRHGREPAQKAVTAVVRRRSARRSAFAHAATLRSGSVLQAFHDGEPTWIVFAGEEPIAAYPPVPVPLPPLIAHSDLGQRRLSQRKGES